MVVGTLVVGRSFVPNQLINVGIGDQSMGFSYPKTQIS